MNVFECGGEVNVSGFYDGDKERVSFPCFNEKAFFRIKIIPSVNWEVPFPQPPEGSST